MFLLSEIFGVNIFCYKFMNYSISQNKGKLKKLLIVFVILLLALLSFMAGLFFSGKNEVLKEMAKKEAIYVGKVIGLYSEARSGVLSQDISFDLFWETWDALKNNYVDQEKLDDKKMFYGALKGLVASAGDPYTVFMDPKITQEFSEDMAGTFEGIGAEIGIKNEVLTIIAPLPEMPAEKAGLKSGDKILAIDGESTAGIFIDEAVNKIRGQKGTDVVLSIFREGFEEYKDITITRGTIVVNSISTEILPDDIFLLKITNFNSDTEFLFNKAVREILDKNSKGIIIDLRNNPGGYLDTSIEVASEWVDDNVVVIEKYSDETQNENLSRGRPRLAEIPTIVLVNQGSASASEIVAGALQDYKKAIILGEETFGKGSVQNLESLKDGSSIKITVAKWLTPNGRSINDEGIMPDETVELTLEEYNEDKDPQMDKAIEILKNQEEYQEILNREEDSNNNEEENKN